MNVAPGTRPDMNDDLKGRRVRVGPDLLAANASGQMALGQRFAEQFIESFDPRLPGDANGDEVVMFADFAIFQNHFNQAGGWPDGDFNGDGKVGYADFQILQNHFDAGTENGEVLSSNLSTPEPGTLALLGLGGVVALKRRRL